MTTSGNGRRGFAAMPEGVLREIASRGGVAAHARGTAHEFTSAEARTAGRKGGATVGRDREYMATIGRRGGRVSGERRQRARGLPPVDAPAGGEGARAGAEESRPPQDSPAN